MTPADQDRADRAHDKAVAELARRLQPWAVTDEGAMADPTAFARDFINWMVEHGARWPPGTTPPNRTTGDPPNAVFRAARQGFTPEQPPADPQ